MARKRNLEQQHVERAEEQVMGSAFRGQDLWVESQAKAFDRFDEVARRWLDRRREALDATRQSLEEMRDSSDLGELMRIQQEWVVGSMRRITADFVELSGIALNLAQGATTQLARAAEGSAHDMAHAGRELASAAGSKPGMHTIK
ncbi:MAG TPA: phasin family protein [Stellaceae bacterium]|nr:phasin family protein [Stellaceae bacterium]